ncbi:hypothetical protein VZO05_07845 [Aggregatilineales bacterium SYSU G02658]
MKTNSNTIQARELWEIVQSGQLEILAKCLDLPYHPLTSLVGTVEQLYRNPSTVFLGDELNEYLNGNYRDVLRRLERIEDSDNLVVVLLKVVCLLQMEALNETIGGTRPVDYLRDRTLKQIKQLGKTDELRVITKWLEAFCLGYELPSEFWGSTS